MREFRGRSRASLSVAVAVLVAVLVAACSGGDSGPPKVATVTVTALSTQLEVGATLQLTASPRDGNGNGLTGRSVTWLSSAPTIASVDAGGIVSGVSPGSATITATSEGASGTVGLSVVPVPVSSVLIDNRTPSVREGSTAQLTAIAVDAIGRTLSGRTISWSSATPAIASVSQQGLVSGVTVGTSYIRATSEGKTDSVPMIVRSINAPTITGAGPTTWIPQGQATISGTNFSADINGNEVRVNGVRATVTAASTTQLTITVPSITALPCTPTGPVPISVSVGGDVVNSAANLAMATQRQLAVGESMLLTAANDLTCNEFSATGGTYVVTAFNAATSPGQTATFQLSGAARTSSASTSLAPAVVHAYSAPSVATAGPIAVQGRSREDRLAIGHAAVLEENLAYLQRHPNMRAAMAAKRERERAAFSRSGAVRSLADEANVPSVGDKGWHRMMRTFGNYNTFDSVRTRVVYVGPKLIIMEDSLSPLAGTMDAEYTAIGTEFDRDMFGYLSNFGDPLVLDAEYDNNGRVIAIFSRKVNDYTIGSGGSLLGFVTSCDFAPRTDPTPGNACIPSNEGEYFYAFVPNPSGTGNSSWSLEDWRHYVRGTLLHEFKHVVMFAERIARDANFAEEGWLEEATAQMATEFWARHLYGNKPQKANVVWNDGIICDYVRTGDARCPTGDPVEAIGHHMGFLYRHYTSNESKSIINSGDNVIYGSSWSFARWVTDSYGGADEGTFVRSLVQQRDDRGIVNLQNRTGRPWSELLGYFSLASASDDYPGGTIADPRARLQSWNTRDIFATMNAGLRFSDGTAAFPRAWPLNMRAVSFGTFPSAISNVFNLPGGGFAAWEISGATPVPQALAIRSTTGGPPPANVGMAIVRVK